MEILKIINVYSRSGDEESKIIKREINDYWRRRTEKGEAKQFEEAFYLLESESKTSGRIIICKNQASWIPAFKNIRKALKKHKADDMKKFDKNYKLNFKTGDKVLVKSGYARCGDFSGEFVEFSSYKDETKKLFFCSKKKCWAVNDIMPFIEIEDDKEINKCLKSMPCWFYDFGNFKSQFQRKENNDSIKYVIYSDFIKTFNRMCIDTPYLLDIFKKCMENFDSYSKEMVIYYSRTNLNDETY